MKKTNFLKELTRLIYTVITVSSFSLSGIIISKNQSFLATSLGIVCIFLGYLLLRWGFEYKY